MMYHFEVRKRETHVGKSASFRHRQQGRLTEMLGGSNLVPSIPIGSMGLVYFFLHFTLKINQMWVYGSSLVLL